MMWAATLAVMVWYGIDSMDHQDFVSSHAVCYSHALIISWAIYKLLHNIQYVRKSVAVFKTRVASLLGERVLGAQQSLLPDRLENSRRYRELTTSAGQVNVC